MVFSIFWWKYSEEIPSIHHYHLNEWSKPLAVAQNLRSPRNDPYPFCYSHIPIKINIRHWKRECLTMFMHIYLNGELDFKIHCIPYLYGVIPNKNNYGETIRLLKINKKTPHITMKSHQLSELEKWEYEPIYVNHFHENTVDSPWKYGSMDWFKEELKPESPMILTGKSMVSG